MPLWGNTDSANAEPVWPEMREVIKITELVTANSTVAGKAIKFTNAATQLHKQTQVLLLVLLVIQLNQLVQMLLVGI